MAEPATARETKRQAAGAPPGDGGGEPRPAGPSPVGPLPSATGAPPATRPRHPLEVPESVTARRRVRRPADALLAVISATGVAVLLGLAHTLPIGSREVSSAVAGFVLHIPSALRIGVGVLSDLGCLAYGVVALVHLGRREPRTALNAAAAAVGAAAVGAAAVAVWHTRSGGVAAAMLEHGSSLVLVVVGTYVAFLTGADVVRRARWARWAVISAGAFGVSEVLLGALTGYAFLVVLPAGWAVGLVTRWALTATSVQPAPGELRLAFSALGVELEVLEPPRRRYGDWRGTLAGGGELRIRLANRDTRGAGVARRLWGLVRLRSSASGRPSRGRRSQLEREALACYAAAAAGVVAPRVLTLSEVGDSTLMLALALPAGAPLGESSPPGSALALFAGLRQLHAAGVAHRDLRAEHLVVAGGRAGFSSLETSVPGAGELVRRIDVAQLLTTIARVVGAPAAVAAMREGYQPFDERLVVGMLQPVALAPWGWRAMRTAASCLSELRKELLGADELPAQVRLERFRWRTVLSGVALTFAAYVLVGQLSKVNLVGALSHTNLGWFSLAVAASAATYLGGAANLAAFVPKRLSLVRGFFVQLATAFVGMAMPPTVGHVAVNGRYLHRQGVDEATTAAAVAISQVVNVVTTVPLLIVLALLTGSGVGGFHLSSSPTLLGAVGAIVVALGTLVIVPRTRRLLRSYVLPRLRSIGPRLLDAVSQPLRLLAGVGGNLILTAGYVVALGASLLAVGAHGFSWLAVAAVYLTGNTVGSAAPTPGGLGAVEVVLSAGLTAIGIPTHLGVSAVLLFRLATFWLPIPAGWVSYELLRRSGTL